MRTIKPKGVLIPIGGAEDKTGKKEVICRAIEETGKKKPCICIITVATTVPEEISKEYKTAFHALHLDRITFIHFNSREKADEKDNLEKIKAADLVWFSGGSQLRLSSLLGGTELVALIRERYYSEPKFVLAGTSAGAAAMSNTMIISGTSQDALVMGELGLTHGLDFINSLFIDTHATERGRLGRLIQTAACNPAVLGVGLGEDTAMIIHGGEKAEIIGSGLVIIIDGNFITYTNLAETKSGEPVTIEGIRLHVLGPGKKFLIKERAIEK